MDGRTDGQTDRQTYRQTGRQAAWLAGQQTDRLTDRQTTDKQTDRQIHQQIWTEKDVEINELNPRTDLSCGVHDLDGAKFSINLVAMLKNFMIAW